MEVASDYSKKLAAAGLQNILVGAPFDFRKSNQNEALINQYEMILDFSKFRPHTVYTAEQTHGNQVAVVDGVSGDEFDFGKFVPTVDGLVTNQPGVGLFIKYADCTPIIFYDPVRNVQAVVHSGWRSTAKKISKVALEEMERSFSTNRSDVLVFIGPTIEKEHFEVGAEVYEAFCEFENRDQFFVKQNEKYIMSMKDANHALMEELNIADNQIECSTIKTYSNTDWHSARREGKIYALNGMLTVLSK